MFFSTQETCPEKNDGSITVSASGGIGPYIYTLGFRSNSSGVFGNLSAGDYEITIKDFFNNEVTCNIVTITEPDPITVNIDEIINETCNDFDNGSIQFSAIGGTPPYQFDNGTEINSTGFFDNLSSGFYRVTVTDANSCRGFSELGEVEQPLPLACIVQDVNNETCPTNDDGSIFVQGIGGTAPYTYMLNGVTNTTGLFVNLDAGQYEINIWDANNCQKTCNLITITSGDQIPPTISCPAQGSAVCDISEIPTFANLAEFIISGGTVNDNSGIDGSSFRLVLETAGSTNCPQTVARVYEISDNCGNTARCLHSVIINDDENPTATNPTEIVVTCIDDAPAPFTTFNQYTAAGGTVTDNCEVNEATFTLVFESVDFDPAQPNCAVSLNRLYSIRDACNNTVQSTHVIRIEDNVLPVMIMPPNGSANCSISEQAPLTLVHLFLLEAK